MLAACSARRATRCGQAHGRQRRCLSGGCCRPAWPELTRFQLALRQVAPEAPRNSGDSRERLGVVGGSALQPVLAAEHRRYVARQRLLALNQRLLALRQRLLALNQRLLALRQRLLALNQRLLGLRQRLLGLRQRLLALNQRLMALLQQLRVTQQRLQALRHLLQLQVRLAASQGTQQAGSAHVC